MFQDCICRVGCGFVQQSTADSWLQLWNILSGLLFACLSFFVTPVMYRLRMRSLTPKIRGCAYMVRDCIGWVGCCIVQQSDADSGLEV